MKKERLEQFNFLRVVFCLWVVFHHYENFFGECPFSHLFPAGDVCYVGRLGVEFFFMLSGFMISYNYYDIIVRFSLFSFLKKRFRRLYPVLLFSMLLMIGIQVWDKALGQEGQLTIFSIFSSALLVNSGWFFYNEFGSLTNWFSNVLLLCYCIWYFLSKNLEHKYYRLGCMLFFSLGISFGSRYLDIPFLYSNSCRGYLAFFMGCLLYEIYQNVPKDFLEKYSIVFVLLSITLLFLRLFYPHPLGGDETMVVFFLPTLIMSFLYSKPIIKFTKKKIFNKLSQYTMCIFLTHEFVMEVLLRVPFIQNFNYSTWYIFLMVIIFIFIFAILTHTLIEKKLSDLLWRKLFEKGQIY